MWNNQEEDDHHRVCVSQLCGEGELAAAAAATLTFAPFLCRSVAEGYFQNR